VSCERVILDSLRRFGVVLAASSERGADTPRRPPNPPAPASIKLEDRVAAIEKAQAARAVAGQNCRQAAHEKADADNPPRTKRCRREGEKRAAIGSRHYWPVRINSGDTGLDGSSAPALVLMMTRPCLGAGDSGLVAQEKRARPLYARSS